MCPTLPKDGRLRRVHGLAARQRWKNERPMLAPARRQSNREGPVLRPRSTIVKVGQDGCFRTSLSGLAIASEPLAEDFLDSGFIIAVLDASQGRGPRRGSLRWFSLSRPSYRSYGLLFWILYVERSPVLSIDQSHWPKLRFGLLVVVYSLLLIGLCASFELSDRLSSAPGLNFEYRVF